jgi:hypothetical protein
MGMKSAPVLTVVAAVLLAAMVYVGSYTWIVKSSEVKLLYCGFDTEPNAILPAYGNDGLAGFLYAPLHALDLRLRPGYWASNSQGLLADDILSESETSSRLPWTKPEW